MCVEGSLRNLPASNALPLAIACDFCELAIKKHRREFASVIKNDKVNVGKLRGLARLFSWRNKVAR